MKGRGAAAAPEFRDVETALEGAIEQNPSRSFLWLAYYWFRKMGSGESLPDPKPLKLSYLLGPNEAWVAVRRNPIALSVFRSLPDEVASQTIAEFAGLVRSGLHQDAADILAGPGWPFQEKLLGALANLHEGDRRWFAKVLKAKDLDVVVVPGVTDEPTSSKDSERDHVEVH
jgi:hypothetical protein